MFQSISRSHTPLVRIMLILICCLFVLSPLVALADGGGAIEPPIQGPDSGSSPSGTGLVSTSLATMSLLLTVV